MKKTFPIKVYDLSITTVTLYELGLMDSGVLRVKAGRKQSGFCLMKDSITPVFYDVSRFARNDIKQIYCISLIILNGDVKNAE